MGKYIVLGVATKKADKREREMPIMDGHDKHVMRFETKGDAVDAAKHWVSQGLMETFEIIKIK